MKRIIMSLIVLVTMFGSFTTVSAHDNGNNNHNCNINNDQSGNHYDADKCKDKEIVYVDRIVYVDKIVEKIVYKDKIVEKIVYVDKEVEEEIVVVEEETTPIAIPTCDVCSLLNTLQGQGDLMWWLMLLLIFNTVLHAMVVFRTRKTK